MGTNPKQNIREVCRDRNRCDSSISSACNVLAVCIPYRYLRQRYIGNKKTFVKMPHNERHNGGHSRQMRPCCRLAFAPYHCSSSSRSKQARRWPYHDNTATHAHEYTPIAVERQARLCQTITPPISRQPSASSKPTTRSRQLCCTRRG
jgi:hypothetical protein